MTDNWVSLKSFGLSGTTLHTILLSYTYTMLTHITEVLASWKREDFYNLLITGSDLVYADGQAKFELAPYPQHQRAAPALPNLTTAASVSSLVRDQTSSVTTRYMMVIKSRSDLDEWAALLQSLLKCFCNQETPSCRKQTFSRKLFP